MKRKSVIIYSVFAIAVYIFAITYFCANLVSEYRRSALRTEESFNLLTNKFVREISGSPTGDFQALFSQFLGSHDRTAELSLKENDAYIFLYPQNPVQDSKYLRDFSYSYADGTKTYFINAKMYLLKPQSIFAYGKTAFLMILVVTLITLILILFAPEKVSNSKEITEESEEIAESANENGNANGNADAGEAIGETENEADSNEPATEEEERNEEENGESSATGSENDEETDSPSENDAECDAKTAQNAEAEQDSENQDSENTSEPQLEPQNEENSDEPSEEASAASSKNEFEQVSFNQTLSERLRESIANEKEFAIFVIRILGIERTSEEHRKLIELLEERMKAQNLIFEGKSDTLILLKQDTSLDENLTIAENTVNEIENVFADFKPICYVGISNRNLRIVTGERLLFEAEAALEHAEQSEEKVIAFRANAEQYNDFMNQN